MRRPTTKSAFDAAATGWFFDAARGGITYAKANGNAATGFTVSFCQTGQCTAVQAVSFDPARDMRRSVRRVGVRGVEVPFGGKYRIEVFGVNGAIVKPLSGIGPALVRLPASGGMFIVKASTVRGETALRVMSR